MGDPEIQIPTLAKTALGWAPGADSVRFTFSPRHCRAGLSYSAAARLWPGFIASSAGDRINVH